MCIVSNVFDYFEKDKFNWVPGPEITNEVKFTPIARPWDQESFDLLKKAVALLEKLDERLGEPNCSDPRKEEFLKVIEEMAKKNKKKRTKNSKKSK